MKDERNVQKTDEDETEKLRLIEASLYVAGRPLDLKTLCSITGETSRRRVLKLAESLVEEYRRREGALEVLRLSDDRFVMQLKALYTPRVRRLSIKPLLSPGPLRTLSYVALNQPITQSQLVEARGLKSYEHVRQLEKMGLLASEPFGRTKILRTTETFSDYFNLSRDFRVMKRQFRALIESYMTEKPHYKPSKEGGVEGKGEAYKAFKARIPSEEEVEGVQK